MLTVDPDVWEKFQKLFPKQASSYCNEQMRLRIAYSQGDVSGVDIELLKINEREAMAQYDKITSKLSEIREQIRAVNKKAKEREKSILIQEQERMEGLKTCSGCGKQIVEAHINSCETKDGSQFCKECFFNQHPKMLRVLKK